MAGRRARLADDGDARLKKLVYLRLGRRRLWRALTSVAVIGLAPSLARAESGRLNLHANAGAALATLDTPITMGVVAQGGFDWQLARGFAFDVSGGGGTLTSFDGHTAERHLVDVAAGLRLRFLDDEAGYHEEPSGNHVG